MYVVGSEKFISHQLPLGWEVNLMGWTKWARLTARSFRARGRIVCPRVESGQGHGRQHTTREGAGMRGRMAANRQRRSEPTALPPCQ